MRMSQTRNFSEKNEDKRKLQKIPSHSLELAVVAKLLLFPCIAVYVPVDAVVDFHVKMIRQQTIEGDSTQFCMVSDLRSCEKVFAFEYGNANSQEKRMGEGSGPK